MNEPNQDPREYLRNHAHEVARLLQAEADILESTRVRPRRLTRIVVGLLIVGSLGMPTGTSPSVDARSTTVGSFAEDVGALSSALWKARKSRGDEALRRQVRDCLDELDLEDVLANPRTYVCDKVRTHRKVWSITLAAVRESRALEHLGTIERVRDRYSHDRRQTRVLDKTIEKLREISLVTSASSGKTGPGVNEQ